MKKSRPGKAAEKIIKDALDDLKTGNFEDSQSFINPFELSDDEGDSDSTPQKNKGGFVDISIEQEPDAVDESRVAPVGLSQETVRKIQSVKTESPKRDTNSEATQISGSESTGVTQPMASSNQEERTGTGLTSSSNSLSYSDKTQPMYRPYSSNNPESSVKVSHGSGRAPGKVGMSGGAPSELQLLQAENLKLAQNRILELEKEVERLRQENELLFSAGDMAKKKSDELMDQLSQIERSKSDALQQAELELNIFKDSLQEKERDLRKSKVRVQELEGRLATDLKKIRVRERELENRIELARLERTTLLRSKDETLLELKRKIDFLNAELDQYKQKSAELNQKLEQGHEQMARTVRALRLALSNLEANGESTGNQLVVVKKAE